MSNFKTEYLQGNIKFEDISKYISDWHKTTSKETLDDFLGLTEDEMQLLVKGDNSLKQKWDAEKLKSTAKLKKAISMVLKKKVDKLNKV
jgi:predicted DNA-binding transcriptional regulator YafY